MNPTRHRCWLPIVRLRLKRFALRTMDNPRHRRRWFQFGTGTLVLGLTLLILVIGWISAQCRWRDERAAAMNALSPKITARFTGPRPRPTFAQRLVGGYAGIPLMIVRVESDADEAKARDLQRLYPETEVRIERVEKSP